nr:hypothetical protein HK105_001429 [Polyrhizophydium stewartii]
MMSSTGLCTNGGSGNTNGGNGNGNGNGNSNTSGNSTGANSTSSGPSMGAIIGGVIGGVALIAVVAILIWYRQRPSAKPTANPAMLPTTAGPATYTGPAAYSGPGAYPPSPPSEYAVSTGSAPGSHPPAQLVPAPIGMQPQIAYAAQNSMVSSTGPASPQPSQTGTGFFSFISGASAPYKTGADNRQSMLSTGTVPAGSTVGSAAAAAPRLVSESPAPSVGAPSTGAPSIAGTDRAVLVDRPPIQSGVDVLRPTRAILVEKPEIKS